MNIETASGYKAQNVTGEQLKSSLAGLDSGNDFLILSDGDNYIQCALAGSGFVAEYQDGTGHYSTDPGLSAGTIEKIFLSYLTRSAEWKTLVNWGSAELPGADSGQESPVSFRDSLKGELSAEKLFGAVKKQISREVGRQASRKTSGLVGKMIRKIIK